MYSFQLKSFRPENNISEPHFFILCKGLNSGKPLSEPCPQAPFVASIFNYYLSDDLEGYAEYDELTLKLVQEMPGYLGYESMKHEDRGTFISYWKDHDSIKNWAANPIHQKAKELGVQKWYRYYHSMIADVNRFHSHELTT